MNEIIWLHCSPCPYQRRTVPSWRTIQSKRDRPLSSAGIFANSPRLPRRLRFLVHKALVPVPARGKKDPFVTPAPRRRSRSPGKLHGEPRFDGWSRLGGRPNGAVTTASASARHSIRERPLLPARTFSTHRSPCGFTHRYRRWAASRALFRSYRWVLLTWDPVPGARNHSRVHLHAFPRAKVIRAWDPPQAGIYAFLALWSCLTVGAFIPGFAFPLTKPCGDI